MNSLVSCIIPTRNGVRFIGQAIESLLAQSWPQIEIVVVNDGSTDRSGEIAAAFGDPVRVLNHPVGSPVLARNHGIANAKGAYLAFLDQDDLHVPEKIAWQLKALYEDPGLDVCVGMVQRFRQASSSDEKVMIGRPVAGYLTIAMLAKRSAFQRVGMLNPENKYSDSAEWFLRARRCGLGVRLLPQTLVYHREHESNLSRLQNLRSRDEFLRLIKSKLDRERAVE